MCGSCGIHCGSTVSSVSVLCLCCPESSSDSSVCRPVTLEQIFSRRITVFEHVLGVLYFVKLQQIYVLVCRPIITLLSTRGRIAALCVGGPRL